MFASSRSSLQMQALCFLLIFALCQSFFVSLSAARISAAQAVTHTRYSATAHAEPTAPVSDQTQRARIIASCGKLPLAFETTDEQTNERVKFTARGADYQLFLASDETVLSWRSYDGNEANLKEKSVSAKGEVNSNRLSAGSSSARANSKAATIRMKLAGANNSPQVIGEDEQAGKSNYFIGSDESKWRRNVAHYGRVRYRNVYRGIDQIYYGNQGQLEYDFIVAPGADARRIRLSFEGVRRVQIERASGDLILTMKTGAQMRQRKPFAYQEIDGERRRVEASYVKRRGGVVGFHIGEYDKRQPLIIDPTLVYSTYLGGASDDLAFGVAADSTGNAYVTGITFSSNFPTKNSPLQSSSSGNADAFVSKFDANGNLLYSTYLGGNGNDQGNAVAVDSSGNIYVAGNTTSSNFPTRNAFQNTHGSDNGNTDAFLLKLNASGNQILYSTYLGGEGFDQGNGVAVDASGNAYIVGTTGSLSFPVLSAFQATRAPFSDAFIAKFNANGQIVFSTYFGGNDADEGKAVAVDSSGNIYVAGDTQSTDFKTKNPFQNANKGKQDIFVSKFDTGGQQLIYSTYIGGTDDEVPNALAVDSSGNAYVTGYVVSTDFPVVNPFQRAKGGGFADAFVTKLNATGNQLIYSTYLGGDQDDGGRGIAVDAGGRAFVIGYTSSYNFPVQNAFQPSSGGGLDIFITRLEPSGSQLDNSTYLGGDDNDEARGIALDGNGNAYVIGDTFSSNFPTRNPAQATLAGGRDAFVLKIAAPETQPTYSNSGVITPLTSYSISGRIEPTDPIKPIIEPIKDDSGNPLKNILVTLSGTQAQSVRTDASGNYRFTNLPAGDYQVTAVDSSLVFTPPGYTFTGLQSDKMGINFTAFVNPNPQPTPTPSDDFSSNQRDPSKWQLGSVTQPAGAVDPKVRVVQQNGQLVITPVANATGSHFNGYVSTNAFDFTNGKASLEVVKAASGGALSVFALGSDTQNFYRFVTGNASSLTALGIERETLAHALRDSGIDAQTINFDDPSADAPSFLVFQVVQNGVSKTFSITYDPVQDRFWQFRNDQTVTNDYPNGAIVFETSPDKVTYKEQFRAAISKPINAMQIEISAGTTSSVPNPGSAAYDNYQLTINDIDSASFFVAQHYRDFLNRQADIDGLQFWTNEIFSCGADARCIDIKRQNVSAAYFISVEFQQTGFLVYQLYKAAYGNLAGKPVPVRLSDFLLDVQAISSGVVVGQTGWQDKLEQNKQTFISGFANRAAFKAQYPATLTNAQFVDALNANTGGSLTTAQRNQLVTGLQNGTLTRATVLRAIADPDQNPAFKKAEFNRAFVLMQYFGYLRRNPDDAPDGSFAGYNFWLTKLNSFNGDYIQSEMVRSFTTSQEYRKRFGP